VPQDTCDAEAELRLAAPYTMAAGIGAVNFSDFSLTFGSKRSVS
jgi:hypothetical protein